jgi:hypothetical protein
MLEKIRKAIVPGIITVMAGYGISYAATGSINPVHLASNASDPVVTDSPAPTDSPEATESPEATDSPEATESPDATDSPEASDAAGTHGVERSTDGCPDGFTGNHGQFVSQSDDKQAAAQSDCGKPVQSVHSPKPSETPEVENETEPTESPEAETTGGGSDNGAEHSQGHGHD